MEYGLYVQACIDKKAVDLILAQVYLVFSAEIK